MECRKLLPVTHDANHMQDVSIWQILLQKSAIAMVRLRRRFSGTVFLSRRV
jgi:hypothetical protein